MEYSLLIAVGFLLLFFPCVDCISDFDWALKMHSNRANDITPWEVKKRSRIHMANAQDGCGASIPYEMIIEVLQWLPVKSVFRFRAVCRSWAVLLSSDEFRCLHMTAAKDARRQAPPPQLLYISPTTTFDSTTVYSCSFSPSSSSNRPRDRGDLLFTIEGARGNCVEVVTPVPCRGLTLLYDAIGAAFYICNTATRAATRLPASTEERAARSAAGLGFDAQTDEYKVVRLISRLCHQEDMVRCEIYTPGGRSGDRWRPPAGGVPLSLHQFVYAAVKNAELNKLPPVFANGCLHWLMRPASFTTTPSVAVVSFSVTEETFTCLRSPPFWVPGAPPIRYGLSKEQLVEMDDQLCLVRDTRNTILYANVLEIWKLPDYSSGDWLLSHRINLSSHLARDLRESQILRVIGCFGINSSSPRKKIVITTSKHKIFDKYQKMVHTYDPRSEALETILSITETHSTPYYGPPSSRFSFIQDTLAPVHKTDEEIALSSDLAKVTGEILLRLPAKAVIHSKFVCKQWFRLIESENFIQSYFQHKNMDKRPKVMLLVKGTGQLAFSFSPLNKCLQEAPSNSTLLDTKVVCSKPCHGLNLVSTKTRDYLCNPCTGFHRGYSLGPSLLQSKAEEHAFTVGNKNVGLTFDPLTHQHVMVAIFYRQKDFKSRQYDLTCTLRWCNSRDRPQRSSVPPLPVNDMPPAYVEGMLYWMSEPRLGRSCEWTIVSFNLATRIFDVVPCPSWFARWNSRNCCRAFVVELEGVLCAVLADPVAEKLDVWKLERGQWGRAVTIHLEAYPDYSLKTSVVVPLAVDRDYGSILLNTGRKIGLYDPVEQAIENLYSLDQVPVVRIDMSSTSSAAEMNRMDSKMIPCVPMLYEESLACYTRVPKKQLLW
uniref:F-box domain-containing protein n=1 Tax=Aegilops tauschii subsp. strangulata TaxID=200361 RepID=A0A453JK65_AEGTS